VIEVDSDWPRRRRRVVPVFEVDSDWPRRGEAPWLGRSCIAGSRRRPPASPGEDCRTSVGPFRAEGRRRRGGWRSNATWGRGGAATGR